MSKTRLEAFSDAVIAIIITIMVLELRPPHGESWRALFEMLPKFLVYVLSFVFLGIYWNNHHHMLHAAERVNGAILWSNLHLLFWLSLIPFVTAWLGEGHFAPVPTALYGVLMILCALAYLVLQRTIVAHHGPGSRLAAAVGRDFKGKVSVISYLLSIPAAFLDPRISLALFVLVALLWLIPDRRIERVLGE